MSHPSQLQNVNEQLRKCTAEIVEVRRKLLKQLYAEIVNAGVEHHNIDVLLIQDGGCAPGYDTVTAMLAQAFNRLGRNVFVAREGFRSVVRGLDRDFVILADFESEDDAYVGAAMFGIHQVFPQDALCGKRGASFRSERFPQFKEPQIQLQAVKIILERKISVVIGIGGNGTMAGMQAIHNHLQQHQQQQHHHHHHHHQQQQQQPSVDCQCYFIPVTLDSDVANTECIGEHTACAEGAEKISRFVADAATHHRCYVVEMMGSESAFHAVHSSIGGGAHYAVTTETLTSQELARVAKRVSNRHSTVIAVATGYAIEIRKQHAKAFAASMSPAPTTPTTTTTTESVNKKEGDYLADLTPTTNDNHDDQHNDNDNDNHDHNDNHGHNDNHNHNDGDNHNHDDNHNPDHATIPIPITSPSHPPTTNTTTTNNNNTNTTTTSNTNNMPHPPPPRFTNGGRSELDHVESASEFLCRQLHETGLISKDVKIVCEPWSRDIRGSVPNSGDRWLASAMTRKVVSMMLSPSITNGMPTVNGKRVGMIDLQSLTTDNNKIDVDIAALSDAL